MKVFKKFFATLFVATMTVAMCFGLAACAGDGGKTDNDDGGTTGGGGSGETEIIAKNITLSDTAVSLELGGDKTFTYTVEPAEAEVKVEISDKTVVKYENNKLTAVTVGSATVKVYSEKDATVSAQCEVTVNPPEGYASVTGSGYRILRPDNWTKQNMSGFLTCWKNSAGDNLNLVRTGKSDAIWNISKEDYIAQLKSTYENMQGYTVKSITGELTDDTHLGGKRRIIVLDCTLNYMNLVEMKIHQAQIVLQNSSYTFALTYSYTGEFNQADLDLMISQFVVV